MAYTRPWTKQEERAVKSCAWAYIDQLARKLGRTRGAVEDRWGRLHRQATRQRKHHEGVYGLLPAHVMMHDPNGTFCLRCGAEQSFRTEDGRLVVECRCGRAFVTPRKP